jgi:hypothetical protein
MSWELTGLADDDQADDGERWVIEYQVPPEVAHSGEYSVSMPKDYALELAAVYGYDVDDPGDREDLMRHVTYLAYARETLSREGRLHEVQFDPFSMPAAEARERVQAALKELEAARPIGQAAETQVTTRAAPRMLAARGKAAAPDIHAILRADMEQRLDRDAVEERAQWVEQVRTEKMGRQQ